MLKTKKYLLVDIGQVVENIMGVHMTNLPSNVVDIPAMAVRCSLLGEEDGCRHKM